MKILKILVLLTFVMAMPWAFYAQDMAVESFKKLDTDMDARINYPEKDPSGRTCAIIKVVNSNMGFVFDTGTVAVVKTKQGTGEIWVYVQPGVKKLTINHQDLGVLRNWYFPMPIEEAAVYELRLTTGTVRTVVEQKSNSAYLIINSTPEGADVTINGQWEGKTPFSKKYNKGERLQYRVSRPLYYDEVGEVLIDQAKCEITASLRPACGSIEVATTPSGATVMLDNEVEPRGTTPLTIKEVASGNHRVRVQLPRYGQQTIDVVVSEGETTKASATLAASFAMLTVHSLPGASIKVDGAVKGTGEASWEQNAGTCDIEVSKAGHRSLSRQLDIVAGQPQEITLEPVPMYGTLLIESDPIGADIYIDGEKHGTTPDIFEKMLATEHTVKLSKSGYSDHTVTVTVKEGEESTLSGTLTKSEPVAATTVSKGSAGGTSSSESTGSDTVFELNDLPQPPQFPGGETFMFKWLGEHIKYPTEAAEEGVTGRVVVEFIVSKTGHIEDVKVIRGRHPALDKEAVRVVKMMPAWTPGRNNKGDAVRVRYRLPLTFNFK